MPEEFKYRAINRYTGQTFESVMLEPIVIAGRSFIIWDSMTTPGSKDQFSIVIQPDVKKIAVRTKLIGWKFQISVDDTVEGNMERAWNLIQEELWREGFPFCKVIKDGVRLDKTCKPWGRGKQITIYTDCGPYPVDDERWRNLLARITEILASNGIQPSYIPCNCKKISPYISYRNDFSGSVQRQPLTDLESLHKVISVDEAFNPCKQTDPFADFHVNLPQISNPQFDAEDFEAIQKELKKPSFHESDDRAEASTSSASRGESPSFVSMEISTQPEFPHEKDGCCHCCSYCTML